MPGNFDHRAVPATDMEGARRETAALDGAQSDHLHGPDGEPGQHGLHSGAGPQR